MIGDEKAEQTFVSPIKQDQSLFDLNMTNEIGDGQNENLENFV